MRLPRTGQHKGLVGSLASLLVCLSVGCGGGTEALRDEPQGDPFEDPALAAARAEAVRLAMPQTDPAYDALYGGTIKLNRTGDQLIAVDPDGEQLLFMSIEGGGAPTRLALPGKPNRLVVTADDEVLVTLPWQGLLVRVGRDSAGAPVMIDEPLRAGIAPWDVAIHVGDEGVRAYVTDAGDDALVVVDLQTWERRPAIALAAEPRAVAIHPEGRLAVITHRTGGELSVLRIQHGLPQPPQRSKLSAHAAQPGERPAVGWISPGAALSVVPSHLGRRWYLPHLALDTAAASLGAGPQGMAAGFARPDAPPALPTLTVLASGSGRPVEQLAGYCGKPCDWETWPVAERALADVPGVDPTLTMGSQDPVAVAAVEQEKVVLVAMRATDEVLVYDDTTPFVSFAPIGRMAAGCSQPEGLSVRRDGGFVWVHCPTDGRITGFDIQFIRDKLSEAGKAGLGPVRDIPLPRSSLAAVQRAGRRLFRSAGPQLSRGGAWSCATCHTEGGSDGVIWPLAEGERNTKSLARTLTGSEPFGWRGGALTVREAVIESVHRMGGGGLLAQELDALVEYVDGGIPAPFKEIVDEELFAERALGAAIFNGPGQKCSTCHPAPYFTDGRAHDVTGDGEEFVTPSLLGLRRSAPYMHDGRHGSLEVLLQLTGNDHGRASHLDLRARKALMAYLRSL